MGIRGAVELLREARWVTRDSMMLFGFALALISALILAADVMFNSATGLASEADDDIAGDFLNFFAGAKAAARDQAPLVYDHAWFPELEATITGAKSMRFYSYPPVMILMSLPLALFSFVPALLIWSFFGAGLSFAVLRRLVGPAEAALATIGAPAVFFNLFTGQNGYFSAVLFCGGLMLLERRPIAAGICFGCLAFRPQLAVLLPFALAAGSRWRAFAAAAATVAALCLFSLALFGTATWVGFINQMTVQRQVLELDSSSLLPTVFGAVRALGFPTFLCWLTQLTSGALALLAVAIVWRSAAPLEIKSAALPVATLLTTPYAWMHDAVMLIFAAAWLGREGLRTGFLPWERLSIVSLLSFPLVSSVLGWFSGVQIGPLMLWPVLVVLVRRSCGGRVSDERESAAGGAVASSPGGRMP
jgi:alpha-1,2-mannosyltransferase